MVALPSHWEKLRPHYLQSRLWRSTARFKAAYAGRGSGKTEIAKRYLIRQLPVRKPWNDPKYFYGMPTFKQAKRVAWWDIKKLLPRDWIAEESLGDMRIRTVFGSTLYVVGLDKPETQIEGDQWDGGILDESCDQKVGIFQRSVLPALMHRHGWCWRIGVPKRYGQGANDYRQFCELGHKGGVVEGTDDRIESYTWHSNTVLSQEDLQWYKSYLDPRDYDEQIGATWQTVGGRIFYAFNESNNVRSDISYDPNLPICVTSDFNVNPMAWCLAHIKDGKVYIFDELFIRNTNTPGALDVLWERYCDHRSGFEFYGDATSRARKTSAIFTDYAYISNDKRFDSYKKKRVYYLNSNPPQQDRFSSCNSILFNSAGDVRCYISDKCIHLIEDLRIRAYKEDSRDPDDSGDVGHMSDAFGYLIHRRFPVSIKIHTGPQRISLSNRIAVG